MRRKHAAFFADLAERARPFLRQTGYEYWFPRLNIEQDNLRAALQWSLLGGDSEFGLRLVANLRDFWYYEGYHIEGQRWAEQAIEHCAGDEANLMVQVDVLNTAAVLAYMRQEVSAARALINDALTLTHKLGDDHKLAWLLIIKSQLLHDGSTLNQQEYENSVALCNEGLAILRRLGDNVGIAWGLNILGNLHGVQGHYDLARDVYQECLSLCQETGESRREVMSLDNLCIMSINLGNYDAAMQFAQSALKLSWEIGFDYITVLQLSIGPPAVIVQQGRAEQAARLLGASAALQEAMNIRLQPNGLLDHKRTIDRVHQQLGDAQYLAAFNSGRGMTLDETVRFALEALSA